MTVVVIGGGVTGAATAFHLTKPGAGKVRLLERTALGAGATGKSGAVVRMHHTNPHDGALKRRKVFRDSRCGLASGTAISSRKLSRPQRGRWSSADCTNVSLVTHDIAKLRGAGNAWTASCWLR